MREIKEEGWNVYNWRRIYIKFFLKYFLVFLVIILPSIFIICISWNHAKQQVIEAGQIRLQEGMKTVVSDVSKIKILEAGVKNNNSFQVLSRVKGSIPYGTYMQLRYARDYLNGMRDIYTFSPFYCVLFEHNDIFVSSYQCEEYFSTNYYGEFLKVSYEGEELSAEEFRELLQGQKNSVYSFIRLDSMFFHSSSSSSSQVEAPILCVVNNLDFVNTGYHMCAVILPENLIQLLMPQDYRAGGFMRITDKEGRILLDYGDTQELGEEQDNYFVISALDEGEMGWLVQVGIPQKAVSRRMGGIYQVIWFYAACGILLVFVFSYHFGRKQCQQLKSFYDLIPESQKNTAGDEDWQLDNREEYKVLIRIYRRIVEYSELYLKEQEEMEQQNRAKLVMQKTCVGKDAEKEAFKEEVITWLETHFKDKRMSIDYACKSLGVSRKLLQETVKEKRGDTFNVYLEKLRINHAIELLLNTDCSNEQIAEMVGFSSISTYYRVFSKRIGVPPKTYQNGEQIYMRDTK